MQLQDFLQENTEEYLSLKVHAERAKQLAAEYEGWLVGGRDEGWLLGGRDEGWLVCGRYKGWLVGGRDDGWLVGCPYGKRSLCFVLG